MSIELTFSDFLLNYDAKLPTKDKVSSPLKRNQPEPVVVPLAIASTSGSPLSVSRQLFPAKKQKTDVVETRQKVHRFVIGPKTNSRAYLESLSPSLKMQAESIETCMRTLAKSSLKIRHIRTLILRITNNTDYSEQRKLAELGVLYFYVASEKELPTTKSYLEERIEEIQREAIELKEEHKRQCPAHLRKLLPSGYNTYMMRAFVRMVFTPDGGFNLGGCEALTLILDSRLNLLITEEGRAQMLTVINRLISDESFRNLFKEPFAIHKDLEELILIDMKLPMKDEINFVYVRWDLMIALFSIIGQVGEGNCYAVATDANLLGQHYDLLLKVLIEVLKTGKLNFEGVEIPVLTLLESRRKYETDFMAELSPETAFRLTGFSVASECLGTDTKMEESTPMTTSLSAAMNSQFGPETQYAKEIFLSLKQNMLQQLMLSIMQFIALNSSDKKPIKDMTYISWRTSLMSKCKEHLIGEFVKTCPMQDLPKDPGFIEYLNRFHAALSKRFFLVDFRNWKKEVKAGRVTFDFHPQGLKFEGTLSDYEPFMKTRRLFFLNDGELVPVDTLSGFGQCLAGLTRDVQEESDSIDTILGSYLLMEFFEGEACKKQAAKVVQLQNGSAVSLDASQYEASDSLCMVQRGGDCGLITLWGPIKPLFNSPEHFASTGAREFFSTVCTKMATYTASKQEFLTRIDPQLLLLTPLHAFNLNPLRFQEYWDNPDKEIMARVILPAETLLNKRPTENQKKRAIRYAVGSEHVDEVYKRIPSGRIGTKRFRDEVKKVLKKDYHARFDRALDRVMHEIPTGDVRHNLAFILTKVGVEHNLIRYTEVLRYIEKKAPRGLVTPYELAKLAHKALLSCSESRYIPIHQLEQKICQAFSIPEVIDMGNLNWIGNLSEKLTYYRFSLKYDFAEGRLVFCERRKGVETPLSDKFVQDLFKHTELYFEGSS